MSPLPKSEMTFKIESWTERHAIEETLALAENLLVARAAFNQAALQYPSRRLTLRQGAARVILQTPNCD